MDTITLLFTCALIILFVSYGFGLIIGRGKTDMANKIIKWELKQVSKIGRWILKHVFQAIADIFSYLAKQCGGPKKKTP